MATCKTILLKLACGIAFAASLPSFGEAATSSDAVDLTDRAFDSPSSGRPVSHGGELRGNPLWAIPLESLSTTRERPIFLPSRRPPAPPMAIADPPRAPVPPPPVQPELPSLALIGAVTGGAAGIAVFLDETTKDVVRLRTGDIHSGWILRSVNRREVTLEKSGESLLLALPAFAAQRRGTDYTLAQSATSPSPALPWSGQAAPATPDPPAQLPWSGQAPPATPDSPAQLPWSGQTPPPTPDPPAQLRWSGQAPPSIPEPPAQLPWQGITR